jgi:arylsulfatase A-like enzyme
LPEVGGATPDKAPSRPDILLIVLDTVGARHTSLHGYALDTTPVLKELAREGAWFRNAIATASWTIPSHASLFTGEPPRTAGCHHEQPELVDGLPTTAELLGQAGYRTGAFVANPWVGKFNGLTRGFDHQEHLWEIAGTAHSFGVLRLLLGLRSPQEPTKGGATLIKRLLSWLDEGNGLPSFAFLNLMEAHSPYQEVPDAGRYGVDDPETVGKRIQQAQMHGPDLIDYPRPGEVEAGKRLYAAAIRHADELVGRLIDELKRRGRLDRTAVLVTSDHGDAFGEHGFHGHMVGLYEETLHVPLILLYPPAVPAARIVDRVVSLAQVHATLAELAQGSAVAGSLLEVLRGPGAAGTAVSEQRRPLQVLTDFRRGGERDLSHLDTRALRVRMGDLVLLRETSTISGEVSHSLFDLATDAQETRNLLPDRRAAGLRAALEAHGAKPAATTGEFSVPTGLREHLQALGYLSGH